MNVLAVFALAGLATYGLRVSMLLIGEGFAFSRRIEEAFGLLGPAIVSAFVASTLLVDDARLVVPDPATTAAIVAGGVAVRRSGSVLWTFATGFPVYWVVGAVVALV